MATRIEDILPLAPLQEGLLFHAVYSAGDADVYTTQSVFAVEGALDRVALRAAAERLLTRHANLRACFRHEGVSRPVQIITRGVSLPWQEIDLTQHDAPEQERRLSAWLREDCARGFDVTAAPLLRFAVMRLSERRHRLVLTNHHILLDGWSKALLLRELLQIYDAGGDDASLPPAVPYKDYLAWVTRQDTAAARRAWREALAGLDEGTRLFDAGHVAATARRDEAHVVLPLPLSAALKARARTSQWTVNAILQAAWAIVLSRLAGRDDVVFGTAASGRPPDVPGVETMVGLFINTVPVRARVPAAARLGEIVAHLHRQQAELLPYHYLSLTDIQRMAAVGDLFDTMFVFENYPAVQAARADRAATAPRITVDRTKGETHYPLSLTAAGAGERLNIILGFRPDCVDRRRVEAILAHVQRVIEAIVDDPSRRVAAVPALSDVERQTMLVEWNATARDIPRAGIAALVEAQAARTPDAVAIVDGDRVLTYAEMNAGANRLAHELIARGNGPESVVAITLERSPAFVVALLAVWKAGAAVLPIDPAQPPARRQWMIAEAGATTLISASAHEPMAIGASLSATIVVDEPATVDALRARPSTDPGDAAHVAPLLHDRAAYVLYTSGSTGPANAVVVPERALVNKIASLAAELEVSPSTRWLATTAVGFDPVLQQLLVPLVRGGAVVIVSDDDRLDPAIVRQRMAHAGVSIVNGPPPFLAEMLGYGAPDRNLAVVISGGDRLLGPVAAHLRRRTAARILNLYGPTEACIDASQHEVSASDEDGPVPIGAPMSNYALYVLDAALEPALPGVTGELYIGGPGLARGYARKPALTAARFVAAPFAAAGARMYRTGDLARWRTDGRLEFMGRADRQIKVRGFRVEPAEIESALLSTPGIQDAIVVAREDVPGDRRLVAYVAGANGSTPDVVALRADLAGRFPEYLVPIIATLERLPRAATGKIDERALPAPDDRSPSAYQPPRTVDEARMCRLFAETLGLPRVGIDDNFFEIGGDSLLAMRLIGRLREEAGLDLSIRHLFDEPTVSGLLTLPLVGGRVAEVNGDPYGVMLPIRSRGELPPLFCVHPAAGLSWCYGSLLRCLEPNRPVYGLQARGFKAEDRLPGTIAEMAADYIDRLIAVQPRGPYHLLGWSFGGEVAYVMATLLQNRGEEVALLALMDAAPPALHPQFATRERERPAASPPPFVLSPFLEQFGLPAAIQSRVQAIVERCAMLRDTTALQRYRGDLLFFLSTRRATDEPGVDAATLRAWWSRLVSGETRVMPIDARHEELLTHPRAIADIGRVLTTELARLAGANDLPAARAGATK